MTSGTVFLESGGIVCEVVTIDMAFLRWGGVALYLVVAYSVLQRPVPGQMSSLQLPPLLLGCWGLFFALLLISYWVATDLQRPRALRLRLAVAMVALNIGLMLLLPGTTNQNLLLILTACVLPSVLSWRWVLLATGLQLVCLALTQVPVFGFRTTLYNTLLWLVVQLALAMLIRFTTEEWQARHKLTEANIQLQFTRALLDHTSREAERMRIARDLHDMLGHHLTTLGLELELAVLGLHSDAAQLAPAESTRATLEVLTRAQQAQRRLMRDVRGAVDVLRSPQPGLITFADDLQRSVPQLKVHLSLPATLPPALAQIETVLMRFMQESLTNTLRHAGARNVWLSVDCLSDRVQVVAYDDGRCPADVQFGHGLTGLQERFSGAGGELLVSHRQGTLHLDGVLPLVGA